MSQQYQFGVQDVEILEQSEHYSNFVKVHQLSLRHRLFADGSWSKPLQRELVKRREAAGVLIYDNHIKKILLIEQFRVGALNNPLSAWQLEVIAGLIDPHETAQQCLIREAQEEANCQIFDLEHLFSFYPSSGASDEIYHLYLAQADLSQHQQGEVFGEESEGENIKTHLIPFTEIETLFKTLHYSNAPLLLALQQFMITKLSRF